MPVECAQCGVASGHSKNCPVVNPPPPKPRVREVKALPGGDPKTRGPKKR